MASAVECTICEAYKWWFGKQEGTLVTTLDECTDYFVWVHKVDTHACPEHEPELAARLLRAKDVA